ncbi:phosphotransferase [Nocardia brasiliensis]|uniref:phosphotransferase n=1 Tax=Nocardia brasiliensis TaxID=37326 RepID=UPI0024589B82|nr:phosphotransferase [Nocardia brasiliensis]
MDPRSAERVCENFGLGRLVRAPERAAGGHANVAWRFDTDGGTFFVKDFRPDDADPTGSVPRLERGFRELELPISELGPTSGVTVPRPIPVRGQACAISEIDGKFYRVHEWLDGRPLTRVPLTPEISERVGRTLSGIHRVAPTGDVKLNNPPFSEDRWHAIADRVRPRAPEAASLIDNNAALLSRVHNATYNPTPLGSVLVTHGDLQHPGNMLRLDDGSIAIVDWDRPDNIAASYEAVEVAGGLAVNKDNFVNEKRFIAGIRGYIDGGGYPIQASPYIFGNRVDKWARWAEHHTEVHRFDDEPLKFNSETCKSTVQRAINLFESIEGGHRGWIEKIR